MMNLFNDIRTRHLFFAFSYILMPFSGQLLNLTQFCAVCKKKVTNFVSILYAYRKKPEKEIEV